MKADPRLLAVAAALAALAAPSPAAALICGTFLLPISVSTTPLAFGQYNPSSGAPQTATTTVTVNCSSFLDLLPNFTVSLSAGGSNTYASRQMANGSARLNYNIYTDGTYGAVWGDGTGGTQTQSYSSGLQLGSQPFTGHGSIPTGQYVAAGPYGDTVVVTVTY